MTLSHNFYLGHIGQKNFGGKLPWIAKKSPKFYDLKKSARKHNKEAVETLKSKIGQFIPSCSSNKLRDCVQTT